MRTEMNGFRDLVRSGWDAGPGLMQRPGEAGGGQGVEACARGGGGPENVTAGLQLPDARVRASETETRSESELVAEAPRS